MGFGESASKLKLYKALADGGISPHGVSLKWNLPKDGEPGAWMPEIIGDLAPHQNGYYLSRIDNLVMWLNAEIYKAEHSGEMIEYNDFVMVRKVRLLSRFETWNDRTARLFACDCAERALDKVDDPDRRFVNAVDIARRFAIGEVAQYKLADAFTAAKEAAYPVPWAPHRASAMEAAWRIPWQAALAAARYAAWDVAKEVICPIEREWQTKRLLDYLEERI